MRSGFLALCGFAFLQSVLLGQASSPPAIISNPTGAAVYYGDAVALTARVEGSLPLTLQWYRDSVVFKQPDPPQPPDPRFTISSVTLADGTIEATLTFAAVTPSDTAVYHLVATNPFGSAATFPALIHVTKRPQTIAFNPATTTVVAGSGVALIATSSANLPVTITLVSGAASLNGNLLTGSGGNVVVRATQAGNERIAAADSVDRTFSFVAGSLTPFITSSPLDQTVTAGAGVTLHAAAIGTPAPTYQWQKDGTTIPGAT